MEVWQLVISIVGPAVTLLLLVYGWGKVNGMVTERFKGVDMRMKEQDDRIEKIDQHLYRLDTQRDTIIDAISDIKVALAVLQAMIKDLKDDHNKK